MKKVLINLIEVIRKAEKYPDNNEHFASFKDLSQNVQAPDLMMAEAGELSILQRLANNGFAKYINYLLHAFPEIDPDFTGDSFIPPAIFLAINNSHLEVVRVFIDHMLENLQNRRISTISFETIDKHAGRSILHSIPFHRQDPDSVRIAEEILEIENPILRSQLRNVINIRDKEGHTALDYAILAYTPVYMKMLITLGASVAHHGLDDVITKIPPDVLENVLNTNCLKLETTDGQRFEDGRDSTIFQQLGENVSISASFDFLVPTNIRMGTAVGDNYVAKLENRYN